MSQTHRSAGPSPFTAEKPVIHGRNEEYQAALDRAREAAPGQELNAALGRPDHWIEDQDKRIPFWREARTIAAAKKVPKRETETWVRQKLRVNNMHSYEGSPETAIETLKGEDENMSEQVANKITANEWGALCAKYSVTNNQFVDWYNLTAHTTIARPSDLAISRDTMEMLVIQCADSRNSQQPSQGEGDAEQTLTWNMDIWLDSAHWRESPVVVFPKRDGGVFYKGVCFSVTLRWGGDFNTAIYLMDQFITHKELIDPSCLARPIAPATANQSAQSAPESSPSSSSGTATCVMISMGESYEGKKPMLLFECDGFDSPIKYPKPVADMVKLLKNVRKMDGSAFSEADLTVGRKFSGQWKVQWTINTKDGKTWRNINSISPA